MVRFGALIAQDPVFVARLAAHDAITLSGRFVATLVAKPIAVRNVFHGRFEAVSVVALVTAIAQQELVLLVAAVTELATGLHDALVPGHRRFQQVETHSHLGSRFAAPDRFAPTDQSFRRFVRRTRSRQHAHHQITFAAERTKSVVTQSTLNIKTPSLHTFCFHIHRYTYYYHYTVYSSIITHHFNI